MKRLNEVREQGYALDDEECELGARCLAAPIRDYTGQIVAGVSISGPISRMTMEHIRALAPVVLGTAGQISKALAYQSL